ncbi:MAG: S9 family peptidase [Calditrichaeota bacterium]|nr:MAG: S9 family peptidase [Calditrichota bacterium]
MKQHFFGNVLILVILSVFATHAQHKIFMPEDIVDMKMVTSAVLQPQGEYVAFTLRVSRDENEKPGGSYNELWLTPTKGGEAKAYIQKPNSVFSIQWTPDGKTILFLARREAFDKHRQVYGIAIDGGEAYQLTHAPRSIYRYQLSPDGKRIAYIMRDELPDSVKVLKRQGFDQIVEDTWVTVNRIYVEDLASGEIAQVTKGDEHVWEFTWTPDGKHLIYRASERPFTDDNYMMTDNYIVPATGGEGKKIYDTEGKLELAKMSPDGNYIAWLGATSFNDPYPGSLFLLKKGSKQPVNLLEGFKASGESFVWKDRRTILLVAVEDLHKTLYEIHIPDGKIRKLRTGRPILGSLSLSKDRKFYATVANSVDHPNEVYLGTTNGKQLRRLTNSNPDWAGVQLGEQEVIRWKGPDDWEISGVLIKPVGFTEGKKYPLQVHVHGGPESAYLDGWNTHYNRWGQMLAQRGIMVLIPNYRGSIGKGVEFAKGDHNDLMGKEFEDILAGIDALIERGWVDPARVGIGGGSYGGYASAWAATKHSQRFAASVVFVGISNQISKAGMTDTPLENAVVHWNQWLYDDFDFTWDRSPLKYVSNSKTPTLILHGQEDKRVPLNQAYELYRGLKFFKVPTQLVVYPREGHGNRERAHRLDLCRRVLAWYETYLKSK